MYSSHSTISRWMGSVTETTGPEDTGAGADPPQESASAPSAASRNERIELERLREHSMTAPVRRQPFGTVPPRWDDVKPRRSLDLPCGHLVIDQSRPLGGLESLLAAGARGIDPLGVDLALHRLCLVTAQL